MDKQYAMTGVRWLGGPGHTLNRKLFEIDKPLKKATVAIVADPHTYARESWMRVPGEPDSGNWLLGGSFFKYRVFVNGELAGVGPFRSIQTPNSVLHHFDVTGLLREGANVLGVFSRGERHGFGCRLELEFTDGSRRELISDSSWKQLAINDVYSPVCWFRQSISQDFKGGAGPGEWSEHIDGTRFPDAWSTAGFDASAWLDAADLGMVDAVIELPGLANYQPERIAPQVVKKLGERHFWIDFGREVFAGLEVTGPAAGGPVELRLSENLLADGRVQFIMQTFNCYQEVWTFRPGRQQLAHFGARMFRYAEVLDYDGELTAQDITAVTLNTPFGAGDSAFSCSEPDLEKIWTLCRNTIRYTNADTYTDGLSRERIAYEADSYINMLTSLAMERNLELARRTIFYQLAHPTWPCEWAQFAIPLVYEYYMASGDLAAVRQVYGTLAEKFSFHSLRDKCGLVRKFPKKIIVDWPESQRDGYEFNDYSNVPNAFVYYDLLLLAELARALGLTVDCRQWKTLSAEQFASFNRLLFDSEKHLYKDSPESSHHALHSALFAAAFGLVPEHERGAVGEFLVKKGMVCSVYAAEFMLEALFRMRRGDAAVDLMLARTPNSWMTMLDAGATATYEAWNEKDKPNMTKSHPWGSAPGNQIVRGVFGLRPTQPGWAEYAFDPQPGRIRQARIIVPTVRGFLHAEIRQSRGGQLEKSVELKNSPDSGFVGK